MTFSGVLPASCGFPGRRRQVFCSPFEVTADRPGEVRLRHAPASTADCLLPIGRVALTQLQHTNRHCMEKAWGQAEGRSEQTGSEQDPQGGRARPRVFPGGGGTCRLQVNIKY